MHAMDRREVIDARAFRDAMGCYATGVGVIVAAEPTPIGLTVNSLTSLSLSPPLVLWCIDRAAQRYDRFSSAQRYTISILAERQHEQARMLAGKGAGELSGLELAETPAGGVAIAGAAAVLDCEQYAAHDGGDHKILVGRVTGLMMGDERRPLLFHCGRFARLADERTINERR